MRDFWWFPSHVDSTRISETLSHAGASQQEWRDVIALTSSLLETETY